MNINPKLTRTLLAILAAAVAAIVAFNVLTRDTAMPPVARSNGRP